MTVRLIAITKPVIPECETAGELITYTARVSNPANQMNRETSPRLLKYLMEHEHWSPFEMASMVIEITTTRDIARQILRHRSFSFQEFSQRYAVASTEPVTREARLQDTKNRQNSTPTTDEHLQDWWAESQLWAHTAAQSIYEEALSRGIAKEVARAVLPEGMTESVLYMAGTVRSWVHYIKVRTEPGTQKEHREIADACRTILLEQLPELGEIL